MPLIFKKISVHPSGNNDRNTVFLSTNNWDDYSFKTTFYATVADAFGGMHKLGQLKIGYVGQPPGWTTTVMADEFPHLEEGFFSLGQSTEFYSNLRTLPRNLRNEILDGLRDVVHNQAFLEKARSERVFNDSLLRGVNFATISEQFKRVLDGGAVLTEFHFGYKTSSTTDKAAFDLKFDVVPDIKPSANIHVLIGRNGVGKTTLLNGMISCLVGDHPLPEGAGQFIDTASDIPIPIGASYFSGLVSVSFSAFDPFTPPAERNGEDSGFRYSYIGLKKVHLEGGELRSGHKDLADLSEDFVSSLVSCFGLATKRDRWETAIRFLESDSNFTEMDLSRLLLVEDQNELERLAEKAFMKMSSGHAIVLLTITKLVERADEKTLVIMDEPESHLHPPLLSAFTRSLSDLLNKINGIAIVATHSPVVLQEVPKSCVWKLYRARLASSNHRPEMETFAENVGTLTREVFNLEVSASGFHDLLFQSVKTGATYEDILEEYDHHIGFEGRSVVRALIGAGVGQQGNL